MAAGIYLAANNSVFAQDHCDASTNTVQNPKATFTLLGVTGLNNFYVLGSTVNVSVSYTNTDGQDIITTTGTDCSTGTSSNSCGMSLILTNCTWTASVGSWSTNGTGISATFKPADCGSGSVSFNVAWSNSCDGSTGSGSVGGSFNVLS
jgi:hypothetical protein